MRESQEPKYDLDCLTSRVVNRQTREPIPDDEPIFIFRARDLLASETLRHYFHQLDEGPHAHAVWGRIKDFDKFAADHPDRMHVPGTGEPAKGAHKPLGKGLGALLPKKGGSERRIAQIVAAPSHLVATATDGTVWIMPLHSLGTDGAVWDQLPLPGEDA